MLSATAPAQLELDGTQEISVWKCVLDKKGGPPKCSKIAGILDTPLSAVLEAVDGVSTNRPGGGHGNCRKIGTGTGSVYIVCG
jgi:hypothetical protein